MKSLDREIFPFASGRIHDASTPKLADTVVNQLERAFAAGLVGEGEKLPSETELARELGVSTVTLREALTTLRDKGLVETRRGRGGGTYLLDSEKATIQWAITQLSSKSTGQLRDLGDLAESLTASAARFAALRALPADLDRLQTLSMRFADAESDTVRRRADSQFHVALGVAAQSAQLTKLLMDTYSQVSPMLWSLADTTTSASADETASDHRRILEAIQNRDPVSAQQAAILHGERETRSLVQKHLDLLATGKEL